MLVDKHNRVVQANVSEVPGPHRRTQPAVWIIDGRSLVLAGRGKHFSAGADFNWMQRMVNLSLGDNTADALQLAVYLAESAPKVEPRI